MKHVSRTYAPLAAALLSTLLASACAIEVAGDQNAGESGDAIAEESVEASTQALNAAEENQIAVFSNNATPTIGVPYTPLDAYRLNVADITRTAMGAYRVRASIVKQQPGPIPAIAVAYGTDNIRCHTAGGFNENGAPIVLVQCNSPSGTAADSRFVLNGFFRPWSGRAAGGTVLADGTPVIFNSAGTATVTKPSPGNYTISLTNLGGSLVRGGTVQVDAAGSAGEHCKVVIWSTPAGSTTLDIKVRCFATSSDTATDVAFNFMYDEEIPTRNNRGGYAWANNSTSSSYQPGTFYTFMRGPGIDTTSTSATGSLVKKPGGSDDTGHYLMVYNGLSEDVSSRSYVYVGAYGSGSDYCKISSWSLSPGGCTSNCDIGVHTLCFDKAGNRKNTMYVQTWGSFNMLQPN